jgi:hypothetical protein
VTWVKTGTPVTTSAAKRCGSVVLDLLSDDDAAAVEYYEQTITYTADASKALSFCFAQGTSTNSVVQIRQTSGVAADRLKAEITWANGIPSITFLVGSLLGLDPQADGSWRARVLAPGVVALETNVLRVQPANTNAGDVTKTGGIYFGGVQAENKTFCTSYVPTTTATVPRNMDYLFHPAFGNVNETVGTMACDYIAGLNVAGSPTSFLVHINDTTENERHALYFATGAARYIVTDVGVSQAGGSTPITEGTFHSAAMRWALNDFSFVHTGTVVNTDTAGTLPSGLSRITIGSTAAGGNQANSIVRNVKIWHRAIADSELRRFTAPKYVEPLIEYDFLSANSNPLKGSAATTVVTVDSDGSLVNSSRRIVNATAQVPRIDCDPLTGQPKGLLVEDARLNLLLRSGDISVGGVWTATDASFGDKITAPDGTVSMVKLVENTLVAQHYVAQAVVKAASALPYAYSVFLKAGERKHARIRIDGSSSNGYTLDVNLESGTIGAATILGAGWTSASANIESYGDGIYRVSLMATSDTAAAVRVLVQTATGVGLINYQGDGTSGVYIWGGQLEQAVIVSSYIPTTTVAISRGPDQMYLDGSTWLNNSQGTLFVAFTRPTIANTANGRAVALTDATANEKHELLHNAGLVSVVASTSDGAVAQVNVNASTAFAANTVMKAIYAYALNDFAATGQGAAVVTDNAGTLPTCTRMELGITNNMLAAPLNGHIRHIRYWPYRLTNEQLIEYTR